MRVGGGWWREARRRWSEVIKIDNLSLWLTDDLMNWKLNQKIKESRSEWESWERAKLEELWVERKRRGRREEVNVNSLAFVPQAINQLVSPARPFYRDSEIEFISTHIEGVVILVIACGRNESLEWRGSFEECLCSWSANNAEKGNSGTHNPSRWHVK